LKPRQQVLVFDRIHCANSSRFHWDLEDKKTGPANCELVPSLLVPLEEGVFYFSGTEEYPTNGTAY